MERWRGAAARPALAAVLALLVVTGTEAWSEVHRRPILAPVPDHRPPRPPNNTKCNYQDPLPFLIRSNFVIKGRMSREERRRRSKIHQRSIEFRTKNYGYFEGFGRKAWNRRTPMQNAVRITFFGLPVRVNKRIAPVFECVEQQLREECADTGYQPKRLSGIRDHNTYHNNEVSNHVYGIALDVDPTENTCCGCVGRWAEHPLCKRRVDSIFERMVMPECWVHVFERFGFYWLGRDQLQDTMHFEFLGRPEYILKSAGPPPPVDGTLDGGVGDDGGPHGGAISGDGGARGEGTAPDSGGGARGDAGAGASGALDGGNDEASPGSATGDGGGAGRIDGAAGHERAEERERPRDRQPDGGDPVATERDARAAARGGSAPGSGCSSCAVGLPSPHRPAVKMSALLWG